ncbi:MAG: fibronectin type III domain-containing protein [Planctomycetota bacterium]
MANRNRTCWAIIVMVLFMGYLMSFNYGGCGGSSSSGSSGTPAATTAPTAPSGLAAVAYSNSQINLTWTDNATNETSFIIERSTTSGSGFVSCGQVTANVTSFADTSRTPATAYYYRVKASNSVGDSAYASQATATTLGPVYSVSGAITYTGSKTGRIYIEVVQSGNTNYGTSIAAPGAYTIRGVPPGTYTLSARRDHLGSGIDNASNPNGTATSFTITTANVTGKDITLTDPTAPTPPDMSAESAPDIATADSSAFVGWDTPENGVEVEIAESYRIYWKSSPGVSKASFTGVKTVAAGDNGMCFVTGLTNLTTYYFCVTALVGATESAESPVASMAVGTSTGNYNVSGTVALPVGTTGPLFVGLFSGTTGISYTYIASPTTSNAYSIGTVGNGIYFLFSLVDANNNGLMDAGDLENTNSGGPSALITVNGANLTGQNLTLSGANGLASIQTNNWADGITTNYNVDLSVTNGKKQIVAVAVTGGPGIPAVTDLRKGWDFSYWLGGATRPTTADTYTFQVSYSDVTGENLSASVTGVLDCFANNLTASGTANRPTFNWTAPTTPPAFYTYGISVRRANTWGTIWEYPKEGNISSNTLTIVYNADNDASEATLTSGITYNWQIEVRDASGNSATRQASYSY